MRSEMIWLSALRRETGLAVPEPVPTADGSLWILEQRDHPALPDRDSDVREGLAELEALSSQLASLLERRPPSPRVPTSLRDEPAGRHVVAGYQ